MIRADFWRRVLGGAGLAGLVAGIVAAGLFAAAPAGALGETRGLQERCGAGRIATGDGCVSRGAARRQILDLTNEIRDEMGLKAVIFRVDLGGETLVREALGNSQAGVPATTDMRFRIGSMILPALTSIVFQLRDAGRLSLADPVSRWLPDLLRADEVKVRMLLNNTSGYLDWIQGNEEFVDALYADPFRRWLEPELLDTALSRGAACAPGTCFHYAHTNYLIVGKIIRAVTGRSTAGELWRRVLKPLRMGQTEMTPLAPMPPPALHSYTTERGIYEEATGWSPSWTLGNGMIATAPIDDVQQIARGVFTGRTLSPTSRRQLVKQAGPLLIPADGDSEGVYYAQGLVVNNGWRIQNPYMNGYMGSTALLPERRLAISVVATRGRDVDPEDSSNMSTAILTALGGYLAPGQPLTGSP